MSKASRRSPAELVPERAWPALTDVLGIDRLADLVGIAPSKARRCLAGEEATSNAVATRLRWVALIVDDLAGSYNQFGIRRWFVRARSQLGGKTPADLLAGEWSPDDRGPRTVGEIAAGLVDASAT
jgi:hypothetical protein